MNQEQLRAIHFVRGLGLEVSVGNRPWASDCSFFPESYVFIHEGIIYVEEGFHVGDFLHEAGHMAVLPSFARRYASGDVDESTAHLLDDYLGKHPDPWGIDSNSGECEVARACLQAGDLEATAWSFAAALAAGVDESKVVDHGFSSFEGAQNVLAMLRSKSFAGVNGLRAGGFVATVADYPTMIQWLAP